MHSKKHIKFILWIPALGWMLLIIYLSSLPGEAVRVSSDPWIEYQLKNVLHAIEYGVLAMTISLPFYWEKHQFTGKMMIYIWLWCIFFAITDEFHQSFTPNREMSISDWVIDTIGSGVSLFSLYKLRKPLLK